ncbi:hypothetical protein B0H11DRAFT_1936181 [Mycena galericulata]|nr:hypothetical protein B0H11DRAFT_1936181 [Mycena galericulata]
MPSKRPETNAEERHFMANFRCSTYHTRHREERNAKTRARMAALRAREGTLPPAEQERKRVARHAAAAKYREKWGFRVLRVKTGLTYDRNAWRLAKVAREARYKARVVREQEKAEAQRMEEARHWQQEELAAKQACLELKRARKRGADAESSGRLNRRPPWLSSQLAFMWADDLADPQRGEVYVVRAVCALRMPSRHKGATNDSIRNDEAPTPDGFSRKIGSSCTQNVAINHIH